MNPFTIFIVSALCLSFLVDTIVGFVNLKALKPELPDEFKDTYKADEYSRSQEYTKTHTRFDMITGSISFVATLMFWFLGGFAEVDNFARSFNNGNIITGMIFIVSLTFLSSLLSLPFSMYSTFVIEEKFGFNKTTLSTFILDRLKGLLLGAVIGLPIIAGVLWFFESAGSIAWLWCWGVLTVVTLLLQFIAPTVIMPLFNKFTPLEDGELKTALLNYAKSVNFPLTGIFIIDGSKRSNKSNAFFTGFGKNKRIALYDTLVNAHTTDELVAVLAHEVGHYKRHHIIQSMAISIIQSGILFYILSLFMNNSTLTSAFYLQQTSIYASIVFFGMLYSPISEILSILFNIFSRKNEYEADYFAAATTKKPESMINALKKLSVKNLSNLTPHPIHVFLNYSHPPVMARIQAIRSSHI